MPTDGYTRVNCQVNESTFLTTPYLTNLGVIGHGCGHILSRQHEWIGMSNPRLVHWQKPGWITVRWQVELSSPTGLAHLPGYHDNKQNGN